MNELHVITQNGEIIAIVANKTLAEHFAKFLPDAKFEPLSNYDFAYNQIREFMK